MKESSKGKIKVINFGEEKIITRTTFRYHQNTAILVGFTLNRNIPEAFHSFLFKNKKNIIKTFNTSDKFDCEFSIGKIANTLLFDKYLKNSLYDYHQILKVFRNLIKIIDNYIEREKEDCGDAIESQFSIEDIEFNKDYFVDKQSLITVTACIGRNGLPYYGTIRR